MKYILSILFCFSFIFSFAQFQNNNPKVFNVKNFGAKGDNSSNDQTAIQNTINAAVAARGGIVYFPNGVYKCSGSFVTSVGGKSCNTLLYIPVNEYSDSANRITLIFKGESPPNFEEQGLGNVKRPTNGVIIYSTVNGSGTTPALIASPLPTDNFFGFFNYTNVEFYNMGFRTHNNSGMIALDLFNIAQETTDNIRIDIDSGALSQTDPSGTGSIGFRMPKVNNHALLVNGKMLVSGYETAVLLGEHAKFDFLAIVSSIYGLVGNAQGHSIELTTVNIECVKICMSFSGKMRVTILNYNTEHNFDGHWFDFSKDLEYTGGTDTTAISIFSSRVVVSNVGGGSFVASAQTTRFTYSIYNGSGQNVYPWQIGTIGQPNTANTATGAQVPITMQNDVGFAGIGLYGSTYVTSALQKSAIFYSDANQTAGIGVVTIANAPIEFRTNSTGASNVRMSVLGNGNVYVANSMGIGTSTPTLGNLHIQGTGSGVSAAIKNTTNTGETYLGLYNDETLTTTAGVASLEIVGSNFGTAAFRGSALLGARKSLFFIPGNGVNSGSSEASIFYGGGAATSQERMRVNSSGVLIGTSTNNSGLTVNTSFATAYVAKTGTYTATASDHTIDCTSGTFTVTLPTAASIAGREYVIVNSGSGTITIATTSSQTFTNITSTPTTLTLAPVGTAAIVEYKLKSTGSNWIVTGKVKNE